MLAVADENLLSDGNTCVNIKLVRSPENLRDDSLAFNPFMCHQIFGEKEVIYGYRDLKIMVYYTAGWMEIYLGVEYAYKLPDVQPADLLRKITKAYQLPVIENLDVFEEKILNEKNFKPFGSLVCSFTIDLEDGENQQFEIYHCTNSIPGFKDFYKRFETFVIWFIDSASFIEFDDVNWNFFIVYEKYKSSDETFSYAAIGLATVYNYYAYPNNIRPRISQVLVLPPFQAKGICVKILHSVYDFYSSRKDVLDFTVEDPSEDFQRVRDFVDCQRIESAEFYSPTILENNIPSEFIEKLHSQLKLNKKQAYRVCEILRYKNIDIENTEEVTKFRLDVKRKLNQPFQKQQKIVKKCAQVLPPQILEENVLSDEERKRKLEILYNELIEQYSSVVNRLRKV